MLVAGLDVSRNDIKETGPHLWETNPNGTCFEYFSWAIGARSQSAKTYLEKHYEAFPTCSLEELISHGMNALKASAQDEE
jgi:20S proteasome subunit alpha 6